MQNKNISDIPSQDVSPSCEATETVTPDLEKGITDEMIAELEKYCITNFNGSGETIMSNINYFCLKKPGYVARHPNPQALLIMAAKRNYWKIMKEDNRHVPLDAIPRKVMRAISEESNDHEKEDERIEQVFNIASPLLQKAIKYILAGYSNGEAARKIGWSESKLCLHLARLGGRNKNFQPELFWEKAS